MPNKQQMRVTAGPKKGSNNRSSSRMKEVGPGVGLVSKFDREGRLVVRLVGIRKKRVAVQLNGVQREQVERVPEPGMWLDVQRLDLELVTMILGEMQKIAHDGREPAQELTHRPFEARLAAFDLAAVVVEAADEACLPRDKRRRRKRVPRQERSGPTKERSPVQSAQETPDAVPGRVDSLLAQCRRVETNYRIMRARVRAFRHLT